jgi:hypothetical protein
MVHFFFVRDGNASIHFVLSRSNEVFWTAYLRFRLCVELYFCLLAHILSCALQWGLPTGGSQCIVGGIIGVGLFEVNMKGVNWKFFIKQLIAWIATIFVMGLSCAALFAQVRADHSNEHQ